MVNADFQLQQDKRNGEPLGRAVSAEGQERLVEVALGEDRKGPTGMKKRQGKVSEETTEYTGI
jgi:hypothetical protein